MPPAQSCSIIGTSTDLGRALGAALAAPRHWLALGGRNEARLAERDRILLTGVCAGFIRPAMTDAQSFPKPGLVSAERAAAFILAGIASGRRHVVLPRPPCCVSRLASLRPRASPCGFCSGAKAGPTG
jgi:hypothetical protein